MPLSYTWQLPTFFSRDMKLVNHNLHQQLQTGLIEQFLALVGNTLGIRSVYSWYTVPFVFWHTDWYTVFFFGIRLCFVLTLWYTVGIRSVYDRYTVVIRCFSFSNHFLPSYCLPNPILETAWFQTSSHIAGAPLQDVLKNWTSWWFLMIVKVHCTIFHFPNFTVRQNL